MRDFQYPGRSTVHAEHGMAATSHPLASLSAIEILKRGGNAVDAALAASAVLCVVEPMMTGLGGDCFVLYAPKGGSELIGLNGSGRAPQAANAQELRDKGHSFMEPNAVEAITVPGAVDAWAKLSQEHGRLGLEAVLEPAIIYAEQGFAVSPRVAFDWHHLASHIGRSEAGRRHYLPKGRSPKAGEKIAFPGLGRALRAIAKQGRAAFYEGALLDEMLSSLKEEGGKHSAEDFASTQASWVDFISCSYKGVEVCELPPNGQGLTAILILNMIKHLNLGAYEPFSADFVHLLSEVQKQAYAFRDAYICDPEFSAVPLEALLSAELAERLAAKIDMRQAGPLAPNTDLNRDTTYISVVDEERNAISFINSIYMGFGSGFVTPQSGIVFQNRGAGFVLDENHPNCLEGGKRPKHTIIPAMMRMKDAGGSPQALMPFGVMGGDYQPMGHVMVVALMEEFGFDAQAALDAPRFITLQGTLALERGVDEAVAAELSARGHTIVAAEAPLGGGQAVRIDWQEGLLLGASDPRKDGCALGY